MTYKRTLTVIAVSVLTGATIAGAMPFNNPPEQNLDPAQWETPFPYQRNVYIGFCTPPETWPIDPVTGRDLVNGVNCDHEGTDDPQLCESDWISFEAHTGPNNTGGEPVGWYDDDPTGTSGRQGLVGFYNQEAIELGMTIHLDNWPIERPYMHVWLEMDYYIDGPVGICGDIYGPSGPAYTEPTITDLGGGWYRANMYAELVPNPPWEEYWLTVTADPAAACTLLIDYVHIATECVPEPATLSLLALGACLPLLRWRRRQGLLIRRKRT